MLNKLFDMVLLVLGSMCVGAAIENSAYWWAAFGMVAVIIFAAGFILDFYKENPND